jgi:phospholipid/cholesterol/gamma-HCH transport system substrate-binding protein
METKANYVAVGAFVMLCIAGVMVALLWLAGIQYSQEYDYYQVYFTGAVTGLGKGTAVRYNGIEVGRVDDLRFDPNDPQRVITTLEVQPGLNLRADSQASIDSQGLTGGSFVEITGGTASSPLLVPQPGQRYAVIRAKASTLEQIEQSAPQLLAKLNLAADRVNDLLNDKNRKSISDMLANLDETTSTLAHNSGNIDATLKNFANASAKIGPLAADGDVTMGKFGKLASDADVLVKSPALADLSDVTADMKKLMVSLTTLSNQLNSTPTKLLFGDRRKGYSPDGK